ncbi:MAG TPA: hypothetical protein VEO55_01485, partial [Candidatus Dormibacteraeota bacterium]|nr:hypothetical protein [Candidatus Dormibacteraeota bacterium]
MKAPTIVIAALSAIALIGSGCGHPPPRPAPPPMHAESDAEPASGLSQINANSVFGDVKVAAVPDLCAGRVRLAQGAATVNDSCFTGDTNVVLCTDSTAANAVECAAANG